MAGKNKKKQQETLAEQADKYLLYEQSVQAADAEIDFVDETYTKIRGRQASLLCEDFCGAMNTSCEWIKRRASNAAYCIDIDPEVLSWGRDHHHTGLTADQSARIHVINGDVMHSQIEPVDIILAVNFSYWLFKTRTFMKDYFRKTYHRLNADGIFFLDAFGGHAAFEELEEKTEHDDFTYIWDQAKYNPITGDYTCHIHFRFKDGSKMTQAFSYEWRLWTLPELTEMLREEGFEPVVYWDKSENDDENRFEPSAAGDADAGWIAYIAAVK